MDYKTEAIKLNGFNNGRDTSSGIGGKPNIRFVDDLEKKTKEERIKAVKEYYRLLGFID